MKKERKLGLHGAELPLIRQFNDILMYNITTFSNTYCLAIIPIVNL